MKFHDKLKQLRIKSEQSQEALAQQLHVSRAAIVKWESANGMPDIENLKYIAEYFDVTIDSLLRDEETIETTQDRFFYEFIMAGCFIGGALGYIIKGDVLLEAFCGGIIGYFILRLILLFQHKTRTFKVRPIREEQWQKAKTYWVENNNTLILMILAAGIGGIVGFVLWKHNML